MPGQGDANERKRVIDDHQRKGSHPGGTLAAAPRCHAQGNGDQHQHQASRRIRESLLQLNLEPFAIRTEGARSQFAHR